MTNLEIALLWAEVQGAPVFPCRESGNLTKSPYTPNGFHDATIGAEQIREWWKRWPGALVGSPLGPNLIAIDCDSYAEGFKVNGELPPTYTSDTPSGGRHHVYRVPEGTDLTASQTALGTHVEVKGLNKGYIILAGSTLPDGRQYKKAGDIRFDSPSPCPDWIVLALSSSKLPEEGHLDTNNERIWRWIREAGIDKHEVETALGSGPDRHKAWFHIGRAVFERFHHEPIVQAVLEWLDGQAAPSSTGLVDRTADIQKIVESVHKKGLQGTPTDPAEGGEDNLTRWPVLMPASDPSIVPVPFRYGVNGVIPDVGLAIFYADAGVGKSHTVMRFFAEWMMGRPDAVGLLTRGPDCREGPPPKRLLWVAVEDDKGTVKTTMQRVMRGLGVLDPAQWPEIVPFYTLEWERMNPGKKFNLEIISDAIRRYQADACVCDYLNGLLDLGAASGDPNANFKQLQPLRHAARVEHKIPIVVVHHHNRSGSFSGSQQLINSADVFIELRRRKNQIPDLKETVLEIVLEKSKGPRPFNTWGVVQEFKDGAVHYRSTTEQEDEAGSLTEAERDVLKQIPLSGFVYASDLNGARSRKRRAIEHLEELGYLQKDEQNCKNKSPALSLTESGRKSRFGWVE